MSRNNRRLVNIYVDMDRIENKMNFNWLEFKGSLWLSRLPHPKGNVPPTTYLGWILKNLISIFDLEYKKKFDSYSIRKVVDIDLFYIIKKYMFYTLH